MNDKKSGQLRPKQEMDDEDWKHTSITRMEALNTQAWIVTAKRLNYYLVMTREVVTGEDWRQRTRALVMVVMSGEWTKIRLDNGSNISAISESFSGRLN